MRTYLEKIKESQEIIRVEKEKLKKGRKGLTKGYGGNLKKFRDRASLTVQELADYTGLSKSMLNAIESGKQTGSLESFLIICQVLEVDPNTMLRVEE